MSSSGTSSNLSTRSFDIKSLSISICSALSSRYVRRRKAETVHVLPQGLLPEQRSPRIVFALSFRHVHARGRFQEYRRLYTGLRVRHVLAYRSRAVSRVSQEQLHGRTAGRWLQGLSDLPGRDVHLSAGCAWSRSVQSQVFTGHVLRHGAGSLCTVSQGLLPAATRGHHRRRVPDEHVHRWSRRGRSRRVQAGAVHRQRVPTRWLVRADGSRCPVPLPRRFLRQALRGGHRRVCFPALLQRGYVHRSATGLQMPVRQRVFRDQLSGGEVGLFERHVPGEGDVQGRAWV